jgi:hypothetical protein
MLVKLTVGVECKFVNHLEGFGVLFNPKSQNDNDDELTGPPKPLLFNNGRCRVAKFPCKMAILALFDQKMLLLKIFSNFIL